MEHIVPSNSPRPLHFTAITMFLFKLFVVFFSLIQAWRLNIYILIHFNYFECPMPNTHTHTQTLSSFDDFMMNNMYLPLPFDSIEHNNSSVINSEVYSLKRST